MPNKTPSFLTIKRNQQGVAPIVIIAVVAVVVLIGGGYFFLSKSGKVPSASSLTENIPGAQSLTLNPNCKYNDPDLCKFINNWREVKNFSAKTVMTGKDGKMESLYEMSGDDRTHMAMTLGGQPSMETIYIGETTYTKDFSDNKWWKQTHKKVELEETVGDDFKFDDTEAEDKTEYKKEGKEACGNLQCFKYQMVDPSSTDGKQWIWFDDREYRMRKMRIEDNEGNITESEFSYTSVNISEPSPVKEAKEGEAILPTGGAFGMTEEDKKAYEEALKQSQQMQNSGSSFSTDNYEGGSEE